MRNPDGTATCDRCGSVLGGFGVVEGLIGSRLDPVSGDFVDTIYCYANGCRDAMLQGAVAFPDVGSDNPGCTFCGDPVAAWSPVFALIMRDIGEDGRDRPLAFCRSRNHQQMILNRAGAA